MTKPYYEDAKVTIYHGDCREIVPSLRPGGNTTWPSPEVLITDPPYGVDFGGKSTKHTPRSGKGYTTPDSQIGPAVVSELLERVVRGVVFPGVRLMFQYPEPTDVGCVFCPSGAGVGPWGFVCFHPVLFYGKTPKRNGSLPASLSSFDTADTADHPCPKPLSWLTWVVTLATEPGDLILDPFMGSGTTLRAARDLGRRAIGIDVEERYCEIAARRLDQGVLDLGGVA